MKPSPLFLIKVCGITSEDDARAAIDAGANALGFIFHPQSPRYIPPERASEIIDRVAGNYLGVGVCVRTAPPELTGMDILQVHGWEQGLVAPKLDGPRIWHALAAGVPISEATEGVDAYLLDTPSAEWGGTGKTFDWSIAAAFPHRKIVAGGLDGENVARAIEVTRPWGVDASSRLESAPGKKNLQRVAEYVHAAHAAFREMWGEEALSPREVITL